MPNAVTQTVLIQGSRKYINYITLVSDGSEETDLVVYDSSVVCAAVGIPDNLNASIEKIHISAYKAANVGQIVLEFDAATDVLAMPFTIAAAGETHYHFDFSEFGGLKNYAGTGRTGDVLLTTLGLDTGDSIMIVLEMRVS